MNDEEREALWFLRGLLNGILISLGIYFVLGLMVWAAFTIW